MFARSELYDNGVYEVLVIRDDCPEGMVHLAVCRKDNERIHSWTDLQAIKNELVGPENEAVELYPAESRLLNLAHQYHLWVYTNPKDRFPFGLKERAV